MPGDPAARTAAPTQRAPASPAPTAGVLGCGHALPSQIRRNDDPIFAGLDRSADARGVSEAALFLGLRERRVLGADGRIEPLVVNACRRALRHADVAPEEVDRLYGYVSVPDYATPNPLFAVHRDLGLPERAMVVPINSEFSNFAVGLVLGSEAIAAGRARRVLVACGSNWTRHLDYTRGHASTAGDGAGAVLLGPSDRFVVVDHETRTASQHFHAMRMRLRPVAGPGGARHLPLGPDNLPLPTYDMDPTEGVDVYLTLMRDTLPDMVNGLLARNGVSGGDTALITHQGSRLLLDHWAERIRPGQYLETLETYGNLVLATYPVNLSHFFAEIVMPYVVIASVGTGFHLSAVLLRVGQSGQ
ncbi:3-oxoacyl-ACP synthase III family protein [Micromonospora sp. HUAS LYJ1]|uniref:3-oxoacyl-ACP synthase III family protein n=1 Tax=Micromonospora sp. HUAS LYJ1 TaxID=3061626 RepID=UPI00267240D3|nr:3-oxoacyl-[acyl-carrier-protein] synthase III C-terminal domain-containing protein [Micromonospora sp. HUAS LYJ1]WKU05560.1 3-oxoacyl-[acyl-carrier-protein] synthase III C-terminal domain-containing protein [Micromonospora sp. HUAS LYJ1]